MSDQPTSRKTVLPEHLNLDLPEAPAFVSAPPHYTVSEMIALCEPLLPFWNKQRFVDQDPQPRTMLEPFCL